VLIAQDSLVLSCLSLVAYVQLSFSPFFGGAKLVCSHYYRYVFDLVIGFISKDLGESIYKLREHILIVEYDKYPFALVRNHSGTFPLSRVGRPARSSR
jgi:hypothetical protein